MEKKNNHSSVIFKAFYVCVLNPAKFFLAGLEADLAVICFSPVEGRS